MTLLSKAPYLDVTAGPEPDGQRGRHRHLDRLVHRPRRRRRAHLRLARRRSSGQPIADGTGSSFTFSPGNAGTYTVTYTVSDQNGGSASAVVEVTSNAVPPVLTAPTIRAERPYAGNRARPIDLGTLTVSGSRPLDGDRPVGRRPDTRPSRPRAPGRSRWHTPTRRQGDYTVSETVSEYDGGSMTTSLPVLVITDTTSTVLTTSSATAVYGQLVTFTATVTGSGTPTGTVAFDARCGSDRHRHAERGERPGRGHLQHVDADRERQSVCDHGGLWWRLQRPGQHVECRQPDNHPRAAQHHGEQREQNLRTVGDLQQHRVHRNRASDSKR